MVESETLSEIDKHVIEALLDELEASSIESTSKELINMILKIFSKVMEDAKSSKMTIAKLRSMLGFYSEKQKK